MPRTHPTTSAAGLAPVPVAVLLPPPRDGRPGHDAAGDLADWCGVTPRDVAGLVARYSRPGDLVIELDGHPTITRAARHLSRCPATVPAEGGGSAAAVPDPASPGRRFHRAGLIFVALPRPDIDTGDPNRTNAAMHTWRTWLRPGGYLLTALTPPGPGTAIEHRAVSDRATVIAAGRAAGLIWQQEFLVVTAPLLEYEPRAMPNTVPDTPSALVDGRHQPVHVKVLAFREEGGDGSV